MRRLITIVFAFLWLCAGPAVLVSQQPLPSNQVQPREHTVYITNTGTKYHLATCRSLSKSKIPISLKDAKAKGYTPCSICKPPR